MPGKRMTRKSSLPACLLFFCPAFLCGQLIQPGDLEYIGAFRLPDVSGDSDWNYSGYGAAYYPDGDPAGREDGWAGSIFAIGHQQHPFVSEISIPVPVISGTRNPDDLNTAGTLQGFSDITSGAYASLEMPRMDLEYLPAQGGQTGPKLYFCYGQHLESEQAPSHGWCGLDLSNLDAAGPWMFGDYTNYVTDDYLFEIPEAWAAEKTPGLRLACGRFRDGEWSGLGPALFAWGPWNDGNPPAPGARLSSIRPLLLYGVAVRGAPEVAVSEDRRMRWYSPSDEWSGGAWLEAGGNSAVILAGTKAMGRSWYGYSDGTEYPTDGQPPFPPEPPYPYNQRGWWADSIQAWIIFYDPADLAKTAAGILEPWDPQPYAFLNLNPILYDPGYDHERQKMTSVGDVCYDRVRNILYLFEFLGDGDRSLVHAFQVRCGDTGVKTGSPESLFGLEPNFPNPFNSGTTIPFNLPHPGTVRLRIFDALGREAAVLVDGHLAAGRHEVSWHPKGLASGVWTCLLEVFPDPGRGMRFSSAGVLLYLE